LFIDPAPRKEKKRRGSLGRPTGGKAVGNEILPQGQEKNQGRVFGKIGSRESELTADNYVKGRNYNIETHDGVV